VLSVRRAPATPTPRLLPMRRWEDSGGSPTTRSSPSSSSSTRTSRTEQVPNVGGHDRNIVNTADWCILPLLSPPTTPVTPHLLTNRLAPHNAQVGWCLVGGCAQNGRDNYNPHSAVNKLEVRIAHPPTDTIHLQQLRERREREREVGEPEKMSSIDKLMIQGVRSFSPFKHQVE
jgi:hypothetical protein